MKQRGRRWDFSPGKRGRTLLYMALGLLLTLAYIRLMKQGDER